MASYLEDRMIEERALIMRLESSLRDGTTHENVAYHPP